VSRGARIAAVLLLLLLTACPLVPVRLPESPSLRLSELVAEGDPTRRASLDLVLDGLAADEVGELRRAQGLYARALQVDSGNPYAYLALARHHVAGGDSGRALEHLARARDLLEAYEEISPRVEVHLVGLRGAALRLERRSVEAEALLAQAADVAPAVWRDGRLDPAELR
jgi:tetratricopeptide (TPR) repeat protein